MASRTSIADRPALSSEDLQVLRLLAQGLPLNGVARRLHLSERSIRRRIRMICDRLGLKTSIEAVVWAVRRGLL